MIISENWLREWVEFDLDFNFLPALLTAAGLETGVVEDKLVISKEFVMENMTATVQISPSIRHTDFEHADDYTNEYFDRRDLTKASTAPFRHLDKSST